jgi:hypothetical protein
MATSFCRIPSRWDQWINVFVCMEPSLGRWARSADEAKSKVDAGFRNFLVLRKKFLPQQMLFSRGDFLESIFMM